MAAPYVAGLASLIWTLKPELSVSEVKNLILENGDINPNLY
jgi:subtilisin family serine protease